MADGIPTEAMIRMRERDAVADEELSVCPDCRIDAWWLEGDGRIVNENFHVNSELWDTTCHPDSAAPR